MQKRAGKTSREESNGIVRMRASMTGIEIEVNTHVSTGKGDVGLVFSPPAFSDHTAFRTGTFGMQSQRRREVDTCRAGWILRRKGPPQVKRVF